MVAHVLNFTAFVLQISWSVVYKRRHCRTICRKWSKVLSQSSRHQSSQRQVMQKDSSKLPKWIQGRVRLDAP